jgi:hypothetical protein
MMMPPPVYLFKITINFRKIEVHQAFNIIYLITSVCFSAFYRMPAPFDVTPGIISMFLVREPRLFMVVSYICLKLTGLKSLRIEFVNPKAKKIIKNPADMDSTRIT